MIGEEANHMNFNVYFTFFYFLKPLFILMQSQSQWNTKHIAVLYKCAFILNQK